MILCAVVIWMCKHDVIKTYQGYFLGWPFQQILLLNRYSLSLSNTFYYDLKIEYYNRQHEAVKKKENVEKSWRSSEGDKPLESNNN